MCVFCDVLSSWKTIHTFLNENREECNRLEYDYKVAIVCSSRKENCKKINARVTDYRNEKQGFELNYCPECGKKLGS